MTEYMPGGRRRIDRVLDPVFLQDLAALSLEEVRIRRADADQEEVDLSYARRLLQGRVDLLKNERELRAAGTQRPTTPRSDEELARALGKILSDGGGTRTSNGLGRHLSATPSRLGEHRREAERAVADIAGSDPTHLTDEQLDLALTNLGVLEGKVSQTRRTVQQVADLLGAEIARRYQAGDVPVASVS